MNLWIMCKLHSMKKSTCLGRLTLVSIWLEMSSKQAGAFMNAALYKPAFHSSNYNNMYLAIRGNDGLYQFTGDARLHHTLRNNPAWWMVDLRGQYVIEKIVLTNRPDTWSTRLKNFIIDVFQTDPRPNPLFVNITGDVCFNMTKPVSNGTFTWDCHRPIVGRYVRLIKYTYDYLHVLEYEVMVSRVVSKLDWMYRRLTDTQVVGAPVIANVSNVVSATMCAYECSKLRETHTCTAFNWGQTARECQLLKIDARYPLPTKQVVAQTGASVFLENFGESFL